MVQTTATLNAKQLASLLSLHVYASPDKVTPAIMFIQIQRVGHTLEALVTDRYSLARGRYPLNDEQHDEDTDEPVYLSAAVAKQYLPLIKKADPHAAAVIGWDTIEAAGIVIPLAPNPGRFPAINNLIPDNLAEHAANPAGVVSVKPSYVAKLTKIVLPGIGWKAGRSDDPWRFYIGADVDNGKPKPIVCEPIVKDGGEVIVMIQPNLMREARNVQD